MSASVDQRTKGQSNQGSNGPVKHEQEKEQFDGGYLTQQQGPYGAPPMTSTNVSETAAYMPNYYPSMSYPFVGQAGLNDASSWSNGDPMSFFGGYGQMNSEYLSNNGMFSGFGYPPGLAGWEYSGGDYSAWGSSANQGGRKDDRSYAEGYYPSMPQNAEPYAPMNGEMERDIKGVEHGFKGMNISSDRDSGRDTRGGMSDGHLSGRSGGGGSSAPPKKTWASIASQPAKQQGSMQPRTIPRAPVLPSKHNMDIGTWGDNRGGSKGGSGQSRQSWTGSRGGRQAVPGPYSGSGHPTLNSSSNSSGSKDNANGSPSSASNGTSHPVLDRLKSANMYNPKEFNLNPKNCRFFIIKSYSEDDIHRSIKYSIWCSTEHGNKRLDAAYREREGKGPVYLFYSVNGSGHFCGMAQMMSALDYNTSSSVWAQDKWKGRFDVKWIYVKDVPNSQLRHIRLENNENKPVTNSRDTQEVPPEKGRQVLKIMHGYKHSTSIFDDFVHYEKRQEEIPAPNYGKERSDSGRSDSGRQDSGRQERQDRRGNNNHNN